MKTFFAVLPLALILSGCTSWNSRTGAFFTMGDSKKLQAQYYANGNLKSIGWESNVHTPVTRAHWNGLSTGMAQAALFGVGGNPAAVASVIPTFVNRPTSRAVAQ